MTIALFCDVCGAALVAEASPCPACGHVRKLQERMSAAQSASSVDELAPGSYLKERYRIERKIGAGGFGSVYKAWDERKNRQVAIKQITLASLSAQEMIEVTDSYNRETTFLPRLRHRSLPALYHQFTDPGHWYLVMQYIDGQTLEEVLAQAPQGHLPVSEVISIGADLCDVLEYLHQQDPPIIFRDVKPANIMRSSRGKIYLIDFGIARYYREGQKKDTRPLGSPGYAAPEQYGKAQSDQRTDIYGLGATLQTLLTGLEPEEIRANGLPANCVIPKELLNLISQMLAPDPRQRPRSMWGMRDTLRKLRKYYPVPLQVGWVQFFWLYFMIGVEPFWVPNAAGLAFPLLIGALTVIILIYRLFKDWKTLRVDALSSKKVRLFLDKSMQQTFLWVLILWVWINSNTLLTFNPIIFIKRVLYIALSFAGLVVAPLAWNVLLKKLKSKQPASPQQQAMQMPPIEQSK